MTWFGGSVWVPNASAQANTMMMRVKLVIIIKIPGATEDSYNNNKSYGVAQ